jgi:hypothetical protein
MCAYCRAALLCGVRAHVALNRPAHLADALGADDALVNVVIPVLRPETEHLDTVLRLAHAVVFGSALAPFSTAAALCETTEPVAPLRSQGTVSVALLQALLLSTAGRRGPLLSGTAPAACALAGCLRSVCRLTRVPWVPQLCTRGGPGERTAGSTCRWRSACRRLC